MQKKIKNIFYFKNNCYIYIEIKTNKNMRTKTEKNLKSLKHWLRKNAFIIYMSVFTVFMSFCIYLLYYFLTLAAAS